MLFITSTYRPVSVLTISQTFQLCVGYSFLVFFSFSYNTKISEASARSHTMRANKSTSFQLPAGMLKTTLAILFIGFLAWAYQVVQPPPPRNIGGSPDGPLIMAPCFKFSGILRTTLAVLFIGFLAWAYQVSQPPPPKICGSPYGPPITASRIKLRDGRHLAYKEHGVPKDDSKYKIIFVHGFTSCRHDAVVADTLSPDIVKELGVYIVSFDRPGYGESDPDPNRTLKSIALDIEELADQLGLGSKFYVVGYSMGGQITWNCLKYIPHRLAGAALLAPVVNYWWPGFPANITAEAYSQMKLQDQWALRVAHYTPWLTYWWNTQRWFPICSAIARSLHNFLKQDKELLTKLLDNKDNYVAQVRQQGEYESVHRDLNIAYGSWEYTPLDLQNPFPNNEGSVHLWQGDDDLFVNVTQQRFIAQNLPWIHYHELPGSGHLFPHADGMSETIIKSLLGVK